MPRFLAIEDFAPGARETFAEGGPAVLAGSKEVHPRIVWNGGCIEWETGETVGVWDAPDAESIKSLFERMQTPYEEMLPVEWTSPHDMATAS